MDRVDIVLTREEAEVLWNVLAYGWGDGEYPKLLEKQERKVAVRAMKKYHKAVMNKKKKA